MNRGNKLKFLGSTIYKILFGSFAIKFLSDGTGVTIKLTILPKQVMKSLILDQKFCLRISSFYNKGS